MAEEGNDDERLQVMPEEEQSGDKEAANKHQKKKKTTKRRSSTNGKRKSKVKSSTSTELENSIASLDFGEIGDGSSRDFSVEEGEGGDVTKPKKRKSTTKKKRKSSSKATTTAAAADAGGDESDVDASSRSLTVDDRDREEKSKSTKKKKKKRRSTTTATTALDGSATNLELGGEESESFSVDEDGASGEASAKTKKTKKTRKSKTSSQTAPVDDTDDENASEAEGSSRSFSVDGGDGEKATKKKTKKKKRKSSIVAVGAADPEDAETKKDADPSAVMPNNIDYDSSEEFGHDDLIKKEALDTAEVEKVVTTESCENTPRRKSSELLLKYNEFWSQRGIVEKVKLEDIEDFQKNRNSNEVDEDDLNGFLERQSKRVAKSPCIHFWTSFVFSIVLAMIGLIVGEFSVSASTGGWQSRGTMIADRQTQFMMADYNQNYLFYGGEDAWKDLIDNVQSGWEDDDDDGGGRRRQLQSTIPIVAEDKLAASSWVDYLTPRADRIQLDSSFTMEYPMRNSDRPVPFKMTEPLTRRLQDQLNSTDALANCDISEYDSFTLTMTQPRLWPIWKTQKKGLTALSPEAIYDICVAETKTQMYLEENDLCYGCDGNHDDGRRRCLPPYSLVLFARLTVQSNGMDMSCEALRDAWAPYQADTEEQFKTCITDLKAAYDPSRGVELPESCPPYFSTTLVDETFEVESTLKYTSSVFVTRGYPLDDLFEGADSYDRAGGSVIGAYDTQWEDFTETHIDNSLVSDMALAMGSAVVVALAIVVHTKSLFITLIGLLQIILSFPLAYFVYKLVAGLDFFPFLNFIGVFVLFALGADDVFVAVDKWKNARIAHPEASTEYVAAVAFPDAAGMYCPCEKRLNGTCEICSYVTLTELSHFLALLQALCS